MSCFVDTVAGGARSTRKGKSIARRSRRSRRGIGLAEKLIGRHRGCRGANHAKGKHRTEVTEAKAFWWTRGWRSGASHTSGTSDNLELTKCPRLLRFPVLLSLLAIRNQHRRVLCLHPSSLHPPRRCRPRPHRRLIRCRRSNRYQSRLRSRVLTSRILSPKWTVR
jgi:hypothetical protein